MFSTWLNDTYRPLAFVFIVVELDTVEAKATTCLNDNTCSPNVPNRRMSAHEMNLNFCPGLNKACIVSLSFPLSGSRLWLQASRKSQQKIQMIPPYTVGSMSLLLLGPLTCFVDDGDPTQQSRCLEVIFSPSVIDSVSVSHPKLACHSFKFV